MQHFSLLYYVCVKNKLVCKPTFDFSNIVLCIYVPFTLDPLKVKLAYETKNKVADLTGKHRLNALYYRYVE